MDDKDSRVKRISISFRSASVDEGTFKNLISLSKENLFNSKENSSSYQDTIVLQNNSKSTVLFQVLDNGGSEDWKLTIGPKNGQLKKGENQKIEFLLRIYNRTKPIDEKIAISVQTKPKKSFIGKKEEVACVLVARFSFGSKDSTTVEQNTKSHSADRYPLSSSGSKLVQPSVSFDSADLKKKMNSKSTEDISHNRKVVSEKQKYRSSAPVSDDYVLGPIIAKPDPPDYTPQEDLAKIGWMGTISREEAESKLAHKPEGTFLFRWSDHSKSYVLSYRKHDKDLRGSDSKVHHIAHIKKNPGGVTPTEVIVKEIDKTERPYNSLTHFAEEMKNHEILTSPIDLPHPDTKKPYILSPSLPSNPYIVTPVLHEETQ